MYYACTHVRLLQTPPQAEAEKKGGEPATPLEWKSSSSRVIEEKGLDLREDPLKGPCVNGITEMGVNSAEGVLSLLESGNMQRHQV
jgi:hypothetical protein